MSRIDHEYTEEIVCPFCGHEFSDSWEIEGDSEDLGLVDCESCCKSFYATRNIQIDYSTTKAEYGTCKKCNNKNVVIEDYVSTCGSYKDLCLKCGKITKEEMLQSYFKIMREKIK